MNETFIIKAMKEENNIGTVLAELEVNEYPKDSEIEVMKFKYQADRCEVVKCFR